VDLNELLVDAFGRARETTHQTVEGLAPDALLYRPDEEANSIAWLVWHLTRVQDDHIADAAGTEQLWSAERWRDRFSLPLPPSDTGYGHSSDEVDALQVTSGALLLGYYDAVHERTLAFISTLQPADLDRIVDRRFDPPVSLGVRLVSVVDDCIQHAGQAAYVRGLAERAVA
jgi:uncharacterized damage-inducible protein DinB